MKEVGFHRYSTKSRYLFAIFSLIALIFQPTSGGSAQVVANLSFKADIYGGVSEETIEYPGTLAFTYWGGSGTTAHTYRSKIAGGDQVAFAISRDRPIAFTFSVTNEAGEPVTLSFASIDYPGGTVESISSNELHFVWDMNQSGLHIRLHRYVSLFKYGLVTVQNVISEKYQIENLGPDFVLTGFSEYISIDDTAGIGDYNYDGKPETVLAINNFSTLGYPVFGKVYLPQPGIDVQIAVDRNLAVVTQDLPHLQANTGVKLNMTLAYFVSSTAKSSALAGTEVAKDAETLLTLSQPPPCTDIDSNGKLDNDNDGLCDSWEAEGVTVDPDKSGPLPPQFIDLPAMHANPDVPDIFVHLDWMYEDNLTHDHTHKLHASAIKLVVDAFDKRNIKLHVDQGPSSFLDFSTREKWGALSRAQGIPEVYELHPNATTASFSWATFQALKDRPGGFRDSGRTPIFHYALSVHQVFIVREPGEGEKCNSGVSRGVPSSDFIISLGGWYRDPSGNDVCKVGPGAPFSGTPEQQAGTFMHELGHNLGLLHGGGDDMNNKPNYLSIMSYPFQMKGLPRNGEEGNFDYAGPEIVAPILDETALDERAGLSGLDEGIGTRKFDCNREKPVYILVRNANGPIDWNCNGKIDDKPVKANINAYSVQEVYSDEEVLRPWNDWGNLVFDGGLIGFSGALEELPVITPVDELTPDRHTAFPTFSDVGTNHWAWHFIERLSVAAITGGCSVEPLLYCPEGHVNRAQMAVFLLKGIHGPLFSPPGVGASTGFMDVPPNYWSAPWIKQLAIEGITSGCGEGMYCPEASVTRAQMAVFLLKAKNGANYSPPPVDSSTGFKDVQPGYWAAAWIKQLVAEGITTGCGNGNYCPERPVTRAEMAVFLVKTFGLP